MASRCPLVLVLLVVAGASAQPRGYRLTSDQVLVAGRTHWENWSFAEGTVELAADGSVRPHLVRRQTNASLDILEFLRRHPPKSIGGKKPAELTLLDAVQAGSNRQGVTALLDGDLRTYWEPDPPTPGIDLASQWWFNLDLGRFVFIRKIVLRFVDEDLGDPFLLFDLLVSDGLKPGNVLASTSPQYTTVLRTLKRNKTQRVFEVELGAAAQLAGRSGARDASDGGGSVAVGAGNELGSLGARFVQLVVNGSDFARGREVSEAVYQELGPQERGAVEYHKRLSEGREVVVRPEVYEQLEPARRGAVRYFRRELPRLAELEVWAEGDELVNGTIERGGYISSTQVVNGASFVDGDIDSYASMNQEIGGTIQEEREIFLDLGSFYWIDGHRLAYNPTNYHSWRFANYRLDFSDGSLAPNGTLKWKEVVNREQSLAKVVGEGNDFALVKARFFRMRYTPLLTTFPSQLGVIAELQLYGQGYQPEVVLESDLIRLGGSRNLLDISWEDETPPGTRVWLQTRTGNELGQVLHYFKKDGTEVSEEQYGKLLSLFKGEVVAEEVAGNDWSDWSALYEVAAGSLITSPSPREYLKIRATLSSSSPEIHAALRGITLNFAGPVAQSLVGEVSPLQVADLGRETRFSLYVRPRFAAGDPGFDGLLLKAPTGMSLRYAGLYLGTESELARGEEGPQAQALAGVEAEPTSADSLQIAFPLVQPPAKDQVLRLDFYTTLYATGAVLEASLQNGRNGGGQWQRVDPGNAAAAVPGNSTTLVGIARHKEVIADLKLIPALFTPNGDGINDELRVEFSVVLLGDQSPVRIEVRDLGGRLVRRLGGALSAGGGTGRNAVAWDGQDKDGALVPPGLYAVRLWLEADTEGAGLSRPQLLRLVSLAY
ncbi:MAG: hypothetical protein FJY95_01565 [Candidatus Handelsmanbacteria bacterium]|nr:hypothetical protein [Candidatus Handelsmanbacteria bacterium]